MSYNRNVVERTPKIGDVYLIRFDGSGSEQSGLRPGLIFQNNRGNKFSPNVIALPLTSSIKKQTQPTHVFVSADNSGLKRDSIVLCENPCCVSKDKLGPYLTTLSEHYMSLVAFASVLSSSAISFLSQSSLIEAWEKASELNAT